MAKAAKKPAKKAANKQTADIGAGKAGPGRPKGSPNKVTADVRAMILTALQKKGGAKYLERQADENPVAFMSLVGRTLPKEITGPNGAGLFPTAIKIELVEAAPK